MPVVQRICSALLLVCLACFDAAAAEADNVELKANFANYLSALGRGDFKAAAAYVDPRDLSGMRTEILPLFLEAQASSNPEIQTVARIFFGDVPKEQRSGLSGPDLFLALQTMLITAVPGLSEVYRTLKPEILELQPNGPDKVIIRYRFTVDGAANEDVQPASKLNGRWYINTSESPKETAAKFRKLLR